MPSPLKILIPRDGALRLAPVRTWEELLGIRSELELLHLIRAGLPQAAKGVVLQTGDLNSDEAELLRIIQDAHSPLVQPMIRAIDRQFAHVRDDIAMSALNQEAREIVKDVSAMFDLTGALSEPTKISAPAPSGDLDPGIALPMDESHEMKAASQVAMDSELKPEKSAYRNETHAQKRCIDEQSPADDPSKLESVRADEPSENPPPPDEIAPEVDSVESLCRELEHALREMLLTSTINSGRSEPSLLDGASRAASGDASRPSVSQEIGGRPHLGGGTASPIVEAREDSEKSGEPRQATGSTPSGPDKVESRKDTGESRRTDDPGSRPRGESDQPESAIERAFLELETILDNLAAPI